MLLSVKGGIRLLLFCILVRDVCLPSEYDLFRRCLFRRYQDGNSGIRIKLVMS